MNKPMDFSGSKASDMEATSITGSQLGQSSGPKAEASSAAAPSTTSSANATGEPKKDAGDERIQHLSRLGKVEYDRARKSAAKELGLRVPTLDDLVRKARQRHREQAEGSGLEALLDEGMRFDTACLDEVPSDFIVSMKGVFWRDPDEGDGTLVPVCAPLRVTAFVRDVASDNWGRLLEFFDSDNVLHKWTMPMTASVGDGVELCRELARQGLRVATGVRVRALLVQYIVGCKPKARWRYVQRTGWFQNVFVLPDRTLGVGTENILYESGSAGRRYAQAGTLAEWRGLVSRLCARNSRLVLSLCAAFAGPLLHLASQDSGGVNLFGPSSIGKTTSLIVAASVFGGSSYIETWRATINGLEGLCELHNDTLLVLDEMGEVDPKEAGSIAYMIGNGGGKTRSDRKGDARARKTWRLMFLSSGEVGLAQHMTEGGKVARVGQEVRLIDLPADAGKGHGIFEDLHGFGHGGALSNALKEACQKYHGVAGDTFIAAVAKDYVWVQSELKRRIAKFVDAYSPKNAEGQARRVCSRFAIMAAAGELATGYGVTGWEPEAATQAAATCFQAWLDYRGGAGNIEREKILAAVRAFFETHGDARFTELTSKNERVTINRVGYRRTLDDGEEFYVLPEAYKREVCAGFNPNTVTDVLRKEGWLQPGRGGESTPKKSLPGKGETRVYVLTAAMWGGKKP